MVVCGVLVNEDIGDTSPHDDRPFIAHNVNAIIFHFAVEGSVTRGAAAGEAARVVRREYGYSIEESVYRRVRYDSEYACNELPEHPLEDLALVGASDRLMDTTRRVMDRAAQDIREYRDFCAQTEFKASWDRYSPEIRRALQLAFYTNEASFKDEVAQGRNGISTEFNELADRLAAEFTVTASKNLRQSRLHHQLAKFEYLDTLRQLSEMMGIDLNRDIVRFSLGEK